MSSKHEFLTDEQRFFEEHLYRILALLAATLLLTGTAFYRIVEGWSWVDSFYFSSVAVTTVGFGDLVPTTDIAKLSASWARERLTRAATPMGREKPTKSVWFHARSADPALIVDSIEPFRPEICGIRCA